MCKRETWGLRFGSRFPDRGSLLRCDAHKGALGIAGADISTSFLPRVISAKRMRLIKQGEGG